MSWMKILIIIIRIEQENCLQEISPQNIDCHRGDVSELA